jgi:hypothetical protein
MSHQSISTIPWNNPGLMMSFCLNLMNCKPDPIDGILLFWILVMIIIMAQPGCFLDVVESRTE